MSNKLTSISEITGLPIVAVLKESCGEGACADCCALYGENGCVGCPIQAAITKLHDVENPKPLTLDELRERAKNADPRRDPDWIWYEDLKTSELYFCASGYKHIMPIEGSADRAYYKFATTGVVYGGSELDYGKTFLVYNYRPRRDKE